MKKMSKKLTLKKATLTNLDHSTLSAAQGGRTGGCYTPPPWCDTEVTCNRTICSDCATYTCAEDQCGVDYTRVWQVCF